MKKLLASLLLVVITAIIGLGWLASQIYASIEEPKHLTKHNELTAYILIGKNLAVSLDRSPNHQKNFLDSWSSENNIALTIINMDDLPLPTILRKEFYENNILLLEDEENLSVHFYLPKNKQVLTLSIPRNQIIKKDSSLGLILTLLFYCGIILILLIWLYPLLRRLLILKKSALDFGEGKLDTRVQQSKFSYLSQIEEAFNNMADRIQTLIADNKLLSRAVSHDLKTPLARLRFGFETLEEAKDDKQRKKYFMRISQDLNEMESLVSALLKYAKLDEATINLTLEEIELNTVLRKLSEEHKDNLDISLTLYSQPPVQALNFKGDKVYFNMLINNILRNAVQYAKSQVYIQIKCLENGNTHLSISDDGPGIPPSERKNVLMPFFRGSHKANNNGHGMGLAIAEKIAEWHKIDICIDQSKKLGGAKISLLFPSCR